MAASSLHATMPDLIERFEASSGVRVDLVIGGTGNLAAQIQNGAPADLFFSADEATVERLVESGAIRSASVATYAVGRLAITWRGGVPAPASIGALGAPTYRTIAIANPEHAPYGIAARQALRGSGIWEAIEPRIVQGENVAQAQQFVLTGNADAALVALGLVAPAKADFLPVEDTLHEPIRHAAGILERSTHPAAARFLSFVRSDAGQAILAGHGFSRPSS